MVCKMPECTPKPSENSTLHVKQARGGHQAAAAGGAMKACSDNPTQPTILDANAFTHGGVLKTKFVPKVPPQRRRKASQNIRKAREKTDKESSSELIKLVEKSKEPLNRGFGREKKVEQVRVAFGYDGSASTSLTPGFSKGGGADVMDSCTSRGTVGENKKAKVADSSQPRIGANNVVTDVNRDKKEPFDYTTYYPVRLPLRQPFSGDPELLDKKEFGESSANEFDEGSEVVPAEELDLWTEKGDKVLFFQLPVSLPSKTLLKAKNEKAETSNASSSTLKRSNNPSRSSGSQVSNQGDVSILDEFPAGHMGKLLIYESGAVKLRLGNILLNAAPGAECIFSQDVAAINSVTKKCCFLSNVDKRVVCAPDIDDLLGDTLHID